MKLTKKLTLILASLPIAFLACSDQDDAGISGAGAKPEQNELVMAASTGTWDISGCWCINQDGGYQGNLTLGQSGLDLYGSMDWFNHADADIAGLSKILDHEGENLDTAQMEFHYTPTFKGIYLAPRAASTSNTLAGFTWDPTSGQPGANWTATRGSCN